MNRKIMILWAVVIIMLLTAVYLIGYSHRDKDFIKLEANLREATLAYLKNNKLVTKFDESAIVFSSDLVTDEYIKDEKMIKDYCVKSIVFTKGLIKDKYKINIECEIDK